MLKLKRDDYVTVSGVWRGCGGGVDVVWCGGVWRGCGSVCGEGVVGVVGWMWFGVVVCGEGVVGVVWMWFGVERVWCVCGEGVVCVWRGCDGGVDVVWCGGVWWWCGEGVDMGWCGEGVVGVAGGFHVTEHSFQRLTCC